MRIARSYDAIMKERARRLRRELTEPERLLWWRLRNCQVRGFRFRRQQPFGPYILDFCCHEARLAIALDGGRHFDEVYERRDRDRDRYLSERGVRVLRFLNSDVLSQLDAVMAEVDRVLGERGASPSP